LKKKPPDQKKPQKMEPQSNEEKEILTDGHGGQIAAIFFAVIVCAVVAYVFGFGRIAQTEKPTNDLTITDKSASIAKIDPFATVSLQANSAYVFDTRNQKVLFAKNASDILPLASITKIMTADVASELLSPTTTVSIRKEDLSQEGDSGLFLNERWTFKKLLDFTLAVSSNDGASALASAAGPNFVEKMNEKAKILGLSSMQFFNPTGLDESATKSGAYGSATDVAKLFLYTLQTHPEVFGATRYGKFTISSLDNFSHVAINTDAEINNIPGIIGSKTGFSDLAGGNLAIIYDASISYPIIVVVLGSTYDGRFADVTSLIRAANQTLSLQK
jgi:serine-type D-Ala-D-Ala carboxypeptidase (penicillin-binding protein 5/6)